MAQGNQLSIGQMALKLWLIFLLITKCTFYQILEYMVPAKNAD